MRGKRPVVSLGSAKKFAERQGYCWVSNPEADIPFDAMLYRENDVIALRVRTSRNAPREFDLYEDFFRADFDILQALPLPPHIARELSGTVCMEPGRSSGSGYSMKNFTCSSMIDREKPVFRRGIKEGTGSSQNPEKRGDAPQ